MSQFLTASPISISTPLCVVQFQHKLGIPQNDHFCPKCSVASTTFSHFYHWPTHPLIGLLVPGTRFFLMHSTDCQHTSSRIANLKHYCRPDASLNVSSLHLLASRARIHRCCHACQHNSSHPPRVQLGSIFRVISPQAHFFKWHNFSTVVLAPNRTIMRSPGAVHLEMISTHAQCRTIHPFCISLRRLHEMLEAVPESYSLPFLHGPKLPFEPFDVALTIRNVD